MNTFLIINVFLLSKATTIFPVIYIGPNIR